MGNIKYVILNIVIVFNVYIYCTLANNPVVNTLQGKVSGKRLKSFLHEVDYYGFMGIPFAEPPIEELRFLPPKPIESWDDILVCEEEKPACKQYNHNVIKGKSFGEYGVEDCLFLDVYTPSLPEDTEIVQKHPAIVFLYNEQFRNSYNKSEQYGPDFFIEEGVIIVTISYRLTVFGFLSLEDEAASGNAGLKDIVLALEWVNNNIEFFGGDNSRITLMGAQGGAAAVDMLLHSSARHLFHAAIIQSGSSWSSQYFQDNTRSRAFTLAEQYSILNRKSSTSEKVIKSLKKVSASDLLKKEWDSIPKDFTRQEQKSILAFGPVVERTKNGLITEYPENTDININVPILIGFNSREGIEGSLQYLIEPKYLMYAEKVLAVTLPRRVSFKFDPEDDAYFEAVAQIKDFYFTNGTVKIKRSAEFITYIGDVINTYAIDYAVRIYANVSSKPLYYYHFDYSSDLNENKMSLLKLITAKDGTWGAATGDELCYLFNCPKLKNKYKKFMESNSEEIVFQRKLIKMWANFAKYGEPTKENDEVLDGLSWKPYNLINKEYLRIGQQMEMKKNLYRGRFQFWDDFIEYWKRHAINGVITSTLDTRDEL